MPIHFLTLDEVMDIHHDQIGRYGGSRGVRDLGLLKSALAMPPSGAGEHYFHSDLFEMAAAYLFHILKNHPFVDGNKRVASLTTFVFLSLNGITLKAAPDAFEALVWKTAEGRVQKHSIARFLRENSSND